MQKCGECEQINQVTCILCQYPQRLVLVHLLALKKKALRCMELASGTIIVAV